MATKKVILDVLVRRLLKLLESNATVDARNRQRVVLDGIGTGSTGVTTELSATLPVTLGSIATAAAANTPYTTLPQAGTASVTPHAIAEGPVDQRWRVAEDSHISYQLGIRSHLTFS